MTVFFTTVVRAAPVTGGGEIVKLDWATKRVLARQPIVPSDPSVDGANPRGGTRGGRGVLVDSGEVLAASYHSLHRFDLDLEPKGRITHPLFANLHEIGRDGTDLWVTSTAIDAAVRGDRRSGSSRGSWWPREDPVTSARFGLHPLEIDKEADNRLGFTEVGNLEPGHVHLNAATTFRGRPTMLLNRHGAIVQLDPTEVVVQKDRLQGAHNLVATRSGHLAVCNTRERSVDVFDESWNEVARVDVTRFGLVRRFLRASLPSRIKEWLSRRGRPQRLFHRWFGDAQVARPIFVRGLWETPSGTLLVGISPATILEIDWKRGALVDHFVYSTDVRVCVHGLTVHES